MKCIIQNTPTIQTYLFRQIQYIRTMDIHIFKNVEFEILSVVCWCLWHYLYFVYLIYFDIFLRTSSGCSHQRIFSKFSRQRTTTIDNGPADGLCPLFRLYLCCDLVRKKSGPTVSSKAVCGPEQKTDRTHNTEPLGNPIGFKFPGATSTWLSNP